MAYAKRLTSYFHVHIYIYIYCSQKKSTIFLPDGLTSGVSRRCCRTEVDILEQYSDLKRSALEGA